MNFRERFNINIQNNNKQDYIEQEFRNESYSFDVFCRNNEVEKILRNTFIKDKNVIIASKKNSNKDIIYSYIKKFIGKAQTVEVVENIEDDINFTNASKIIVTEPQINEIVKILEFILCDYKSFIFSLNIKSYENILESLKTLILLNFPNLSNQNVQHLIGSTQAIVIYVEINEKGNYFISNIGEIEYNDGKIFLNNLYNKQKNEKALLEDYGDLAEVTDTLPIEEEKEEAQKETTKEINEEEDTTLKEENTEKVVIEEAETNIETEIKKESSEENTDEEEKTKEEDDELTSAPISEEENEQEEEVKINKYKQLREKLKRKKSLKE